MMLGFIRQGFAQTQTQTFSAPGTFSGVNGFTAPAGITSITVEVWGGGGAGGGGSFVNAGGGGGGAYKKVVNIAVVPGSQYTITVGAGGTATNTGSGPAGGASSGIFGSTTISASGGAGSNGSNGGAGGTIAGGFSGGAGASGTFNGHGGGGGSSAGSGTGTGINGISATSGTGAAAVTGGGAGGNGGLSVPASGSPGSAPGGGGGGGISAGQISGGNGGDGKVVITYCSTSLPTVTTPVNYCLNASASQLSATGTGLLWYTQSTGGTGSSTAPTPLTTAAGTTIYYVSQTVGCEGARALINVIVHPLPVANFSQTPITCHDANDATITVSASGGRSPYTFSVEEPANWLDANGPDSRLFSGLFPNIPYRVRVKDSNTCISK